MKIYIARHGEYLNPNNLLSGHLPGFHLTEKGIHEAQNIADKLASEKIRTLSTSPIERCVETANIISGTIHLHPNLRAELIESNTPLQGQTSIDAFKFVYSIPKHVEGGGESTDVIFERMNNFVTSLKLMSQNSSHVIVSHGDPIDIFLIGTLTKQIPHTHDDLKHGMIRNIPMGGLVMLEYGKSGLPKYTEII